MSAAELPNLPELALVDEPLTDDDLDRYFAMNEGTDQTMPLADDHARSVDGWRIEDDETADWALRKLAVAAVERQVLVEQADEYIARIRSWFDRVARKHERTMSFMENRLEDYGLRRREAGGAKTVELPSGVIRTSEAKPAAEVDDDEALAAYIERETDGRGDMAWAEAIRAAGFDLDDMIQRTPKVYVGPLRKVVHVEEVREVTDDGEIVTRFAVLGPDGAEVPGVRVRPGGITVKVVAG